MSRRQNAQRLTRTLARRNSKAVLVELREIVRKECGMAYVSTLTGLNRPQLYRCLSSQGNPSFKTLSAVLGAVGLQVVIRPRRK